MKEDGWKKEEGRSRNREEETVRLTADIDGLSEER